MADDFPMIRSIFNDDDEIIARLDECTKLQGDCADDPDCVIVYAIERRIKDLRQCLINHQIY